MAGSSMRRLYIKFDLDDPMDVYRLKVLDDLSARHKANDFLKNAIDLKIAIEKGLLSGSPLVSGEDVTLIATPSTQPVAAARKPVADDRLRKLKGFHLKK